MNNNLNSAQSADQHDAIRCAEWMEHIAQGGEVVSIRELARTTAAELRRQETFIMATTATQGTAPTTGRWVAADDVDRLVRQIDVALYGSGAAEQAQLCDLAALVTRSADKAGRPLLAPRPQADAVAVPRITDPAIADWVERHDLDRVLRGSHARAAVEDAQTLHLVPGAAAAPQAPAAALELGDYEDANGEPHPILDALSEHDDPCESNAQAIARIAALKREIEELRPYFLRAQAKEEAEADRLAAEYWRPHAPAAPTAAAAPGAGELLARSWMVRLGGDGSVPGPATAQAPTAAAGREYICPVETVADLVNNLLTLDQSLPIYAAQSIEHNGRRRIITRAPTVSRERVNDKRWIGEGDTLNAAVIWTRAEQPAAAPAPAAGAAPTDVAGIAATVCRQVAELPDRNSPEDWSEAMLVTADELYMIVREALGAAAPAPGASAQKEGDEA